MYLRSCVAHHINMSTPNEPSREKSPEIYVAWQKEGAFDGLDASEKEGLERAEHFKKEGSGYFAIHATRPIALAYAMTDSPVGLLAWIYDKLVTWMDNYEWTADEVLTWVSVYYFSTTGPAASFNTYYSNQHRQPISAFDKVVEHDDVPVGISRFRKEILNLPKLWNLSLGPVVFEAEHLKGGHFVAYEVPELLVGDLRKMFGKHGGAREAIEDAKAAAKLHTR